MGAVAGNQNARKGKWATALLRACELEDPVTRRRFLDAIAEKLRSKAMEGDIQAIKEIGDRIDGKPVQNVELGGDPGGEPIRTQIVVNFPDGKP